MRIVDRVIDAVLGMVPRVPPTRPLLKGRLYVSHSSLGVAWCNLRATAECLELDVQMHGRIRLAPFEVVEIEPRATSPILFPGILIHHTRSDLPERLLFCKLMRPKIMIARIEGAGFRAMAPHAEPKGYAPREDWAFEAFSVVGLLVLLLAVAIARAISGP